MSAPDNDRAVPGNNSGVAPDMLKSFVERVEHINGEIADLSSDRKEIFAEAKSAGFDTKVLRKIVAMRKRDAAERREEEEILDLYLHALGMI